MNKYSLTRPVQQIWDVRSNSNRPLIKKIVGIVTKSEIETETD